MATRRVLLIDLCGTLYDSNTTFDFLHYLLSGDRDYHRFESRSMGAIHRIANRFLPGDIRRRKAISFLKGYSRSMLLDAAGTFLGSTAPIDDVRRYVDEQVDDFDHAVLLSSSLDFIVESACNILQFDDFRATRLVYKDEICEGVVEKDLLGVKDRLIAREFAQDNCTLVTDNRDDAACRTVVTRLVGVARAGDKTAENFWKRNADEVVIYAH